MSTSAESSAGDYYTVVEAAEKLGVTGQRVRQLCTKGELEAEKENGKWLIARSAVHERFADKPPKVAANEEGGLEELRRMVRELTEARGDLKAELIRVRELEKALRQKLDTATRELEERERELREEREASGLHLKKAQAAARRLAEKDATIKRLEARLSAEEPRRRVPLESNAVRRTRDPDGDRAPRRRTPPREGGG